MFALALARRGYEHVFPNPPVGALIINDGKIISSGYHREAGTAHAEIVALSKISPNKTKGSTLYVTLEPCAHYGKTPPCTEAILNAGISKVVFGRSDLSKEAGGGAEYLKNQGLAVFSSENLHCANLIKPWEDFKLHNKKTVDCWAVVSLNGMMLKNLDNIPREYESLTKTIWKFHKTLRKNVQAEVADSSFNHDSCYHFLSYVADAEKFMNIQYIRRLHILRVPLVTAKEDDHWTRLSVSGELNLVNSNRFGNSSYERYDITS